MSAASLDETRYTPETAFYFEVVPADGNSECRTDDTDWRWSIARLSATAALASGVIIRARG